MSSIVDLLFLKEKKIYFYEDKQMELEVNSDLILPDQVNLAHVISRLILAERI